MPKTYTVKDVANILGYSTNSIYLFLKEKRIKGVRVGKGRFRIPEEELARILHLKKDPISGTEPAQSSSNNAMVSTGTAAAEGDGDSRLRSKFFWKRVQDRIATPNLFDWMIGVGAIISGAGLFLFNESNSAQNGMIAPFLSATQIVLIAVGIGVLVTNIWEHLHVWRRIFYILLAVLAFGSTWSLAGIQDYDGAILYGAMGIMVAANALIEIDGVTSVLWYMTLLLMGIIVLLVLGADVAHVQAFSTLLKLPNYALAVLLLLIGGSNMVMYWIGYRRGTIWFRVGAWVSAAISFATAMWYGNMEYWSRSMYFISLGFFNLLTPLWPIIASGNRSRRDHSIVHIFLGLVSMVILMTVFAIYQLQHMLWVQKTADFYNKMTNAQRLVVNAFTTAENVLTTTAMNPDLITAVQKKDLAVINQYSKVLYESHSYIRRIIVLDSTGQGIALYPYGTFDQTNLAFRDYFIAVRNTHKPYTSSVFEAIADGSHQQVVSVTVPLISATGDFAGVLSASIDLDTLNVELQQIANEEKGESFTVVDTKGQYVINSDMSLIGHAVAADDPIRLGLNGRTVGVRETIVYDDHLGIAAYDVLPKLNWSMRLWAPIGSVVALNALAVVSILAVIMFILVVSTWAFFYLYAHPKDSGGRSP